MQYALHISTVSFTICFLKRSLAPDRSDLLSYAWTDVCGSPGSGTRLCSAVGPSDWPPGARGTKTSLGRGGERCRQVYGWWSGRPRRTSLRSTVAAADINLPTGRRRFIGAGPAAARASTAAGSHARLRTGSGAEMDGDTAPKYGAYWQLRLGDLDPMRVYARKAVDRIGIRGK